VNVAYALAPVTPSTAGGAEQILAALDRGLIAAGHRSVVVANPRIDGPLTDDVQRAARARIREALRATDADIVHYHGLDFAEVMREGRNVVTVHLPPQWYPREALVRDGVTYVCVSQSQRARFPGDAIVIENGVDLDKFLPTANRQRSPVAMGRICEEKNLHAAIDAAKLADVDLVIAGEVYGYEDHQRYFRDVFSPRLDARRRFIGPTARRAELLGGARCVLIPSLVEETSSLVAMEALACGTPVIAYARGALPEIVDHGVTGFLVRGVEEMAEAIARVGDIDRAGCRRAAEERFDGRVMLHRYLDLYAKLAACGSFSSSSPKRIPSRRPEISPSSRSASSATSITSARPTSPRT
jgi:glycosyltransferase involved in cell wall biosynthesis